MTDSGYIYLTVKFIVLFFSQAEDGGAGPLDGEKSFNCKTIVLFLSLVGQLAYLPSEYLDVVVKYFMLKCYPS